MLAFPSIGQFKAAIKAVIERSSYRGRREDGSPIFVEDFIRPTLTYMGTVKLHGSNASLVQYQAGEDFQIQSRNRVLSLDNDNFNFAAFIRNDTGTEYWLNYFAKLREDFQIPADTAVSIYGERCGGNIQKGVALTNLPKMFVIFAVGIGIGDEDGNHRDWINPSQMHLVPQDPELQIYNIFNFQPKTVEINFNNPALVQNLLIEETLKVEQECPFAKAFGSSGTGEGIVWRPIDPKYQDSRFWFKVKGEEHSVSKVKTLAPVDTELVNSIEAFVTAVVTEARLEQGIAYLKEMGKEISVKSIGDFLQWVNRDVLKEESDTLEASGLEMKEVGKHLSTKARVWFINYINRN